MNAIRTTITEVRYPDSVGVETDEQVTKLGDIMADILERCEGIDYSLRAARTGEIESSPAPEEYRDAIEAAWAEALPLVRFTTVDVLDRSEPLYIEDQEQLDGARVLVNSAGIGERLAIDQTIIIFWHHHEGGRCATGCIWTETNDAMIDYGGDPVPCEYDPDRDCVVLDNGDTITVYQL